MAEYQVSSSFLFAFPKFFPEFFLGFGEFLGDRDFGDDDEIASLTKDA
jgi:hypothetical protein